MSRRMAIESRVGARPLLILLAFVVLLSARDIVQDLWLGGKFHNRSDSALTVCVAIALISLLMVWREGRLGHLGAMLRSPVVAWRCVVVGAFAAIIYGVTYELNVRIGSGLFNMIDWGLNPALTSILAILCWRERFRYTVLWTSLGMSLLGLYGLYHLGAFGSTVQGIANAELLIAIALASPVCTALSFSLQKWLLDDKLGRFSIGEVLFVRFLPASVFLYLYGASKGGAEFLVVDDGWIALPLTGLLGLLPPALVCMALIRTALGRFAVWQFAIPALCFFGTLPSEKHAANRDWRLVAAAALVLSAIALMERFGRQPEVSVPAPSTSLSEG